MEENIFELFINNISNQDKIYVRGLSNNIKYLVNAANKKRISATLLETEIGIKKHSINWWYTQGFPLSKLNKIIILYQKLIGEKILLNNARFGSKGSQANIRIPYLNKELAYLIGYLYGDGTLSLHKGSGRIEFYDSSKEFLMDISEIIKREFEYNNFKFMKDKRSNCFILRINSILLLFLFNELFEMPIGKKKGKLAIPELIKNPKYIKDFISGFFDAEGHIYYTPKYGYRITFTQNDKKILDEIKNVLNNFNISDIKITEYRKNMFELRINRKENFHKFINTFKINHPNRVSRIKQALEGMSTVKNSRITKFI
jgi:hypothetical protein